MKRSMVIKDILAEATGQPVEHLDPIYRRFLKSLGYRELDGDLTNIQAEALFNVLHKNLDSIRVWCR